MCWLADDHRAVEWKRKRGYGNEEQENKRTGNNNSNEETRTGTKKQEQEQRRKQTTTSTSMVKMEIVSAENCQANPLTKTNKRKMPKQKVLFITAAPNSVVKEIVIDFLVFFEAYL